MTDYLTIHKLALADAAEAIRRKGPENPNAFDCGFAWVSFAPGNAPFVRALRKAGIGSKGYPNGWQLWEPGAREAGFHGQAIGHYIAGATAYASRVRDELCRANEAITVNVGSRYD